MTREGMTLFGYFMVATIALVGAIAYYAQKIECDSKCPAETVGTLTSSFRCVCLHGVMAR